MAHGNWISFSSQSPLETLRPHQAAMLPASLIPYENTPDSYQQYLYNAIYGHGNDNELNNNKQQTIYQISQEPNVVESHFQTATVPKLEDFLGGHHHQSSCLPRYSDSQTETQESSLSNVYEQGSSTHFVEQQQQDLKGGVQGVQVSAGFQTTFSTNSGSEVEDSLSATGNLFNSFESRNNELMICDASQALSLGVGQNSDTRIVPVEPAETPKKLASETFGQRTSVFRGVTRHRWTGRYEAHLWDNSCRREGQSRKGRQVYLGGYDKEDKAARAYDLAALKYWGSSATTNFPVTNYTQEIEDMKNMTKQEFIASLRRKSSGFSRGASIYRGVTRHHQQGRWQARIGRVAGNKDLYLGTFGTEEEAAEAYDIAAIKFRGMNAVTNFEMNRYDVEAIANSALPIGAAAKRLKLSLEAESPVPISTHDFQQSSNSSTGVVALPNAAYDPSAALYHQNLLQHYNSAAVGSSDSTSSTSVSMALIPQPEYCSRNFLYGFTTPLNMDNQFNHHEANANYPPWSMGSSSN